MMFRMPVYNDGILSLYKIRQNDDYEIKEELVSCNICIGFRELNIFDNMKVQYSQNSVEVNMKVAIPQYREITSRNIVKIDDHFYQIYNINHVTTKDGIEESEMTLIRDEGFDKRFMDRNS